MTTSKWLALAVIPIAMVFIGTLLWLERDQQPAVPDIERPDFSAFKDVKKKKNAFFNYMLPYVRHVNEQISQDRIRVTILLNQLQAESSLDEDDAQYLGALATRYRLKNFSADSAPDIRALLKRVDTIPASLALAQSANESAWGTSRFARNGNNFFGIWCWSKDCGLTPTKRDEGKKHEVSAYDTVADSVEYYIHTLNSHPAYKTLRDIRAKNRQQQTPIIGHDLAIGLKSYSERGDEYVKEIQAMIRVNKLRQLTKIEKEQDAI